MTTGPYAYTRNPMYVAELLLWLGWVILFGSLITLLGFVLLTVVIILILPWEERGLERQFGETYRQYQARVPRWLGRTTPARPISVDNRGLLMQPIQVSDLMTTLPHCSTPAQDETMVPLGRDE